MVFVCRGECGEVSSVSRQRDALHQEEVAPGDPAVQAFVRSLAGEDALAGSDLRLVRVIEDLIDLLIDRDVIRFTDLPDAAQSKLLERRSLRASKGSLDLLAGSDEVI